jgi:hypothetical protein
MRVAVEIEIAEICSHFLGAASSDLTIPTRRRRAWRSARLSGRVNRATPR